MEAAEETVDRVVKYAKPLKDLKGLTVKCHYASRCQTQRILGEICEILGSDRRIRCGDTTSVPFLSTVPSTDE